MALQPPPHTRPFVVPLHLTIESSLPSFLLCLQPRSPFRAPGTCSLHSPALLPVLSLCQGCCPPADSPDKNPDHLTGHSCSVFMHAEDCARLRAAEPVVIERPPAPPAEEELAQQGAGRKGGSLTLTGQRLLTWFTPCSCITSDPKLAGLLVSHR